MIGSLKCQVKKVKTDLLIPCYFAQWNGTVKNGICNYLSNCRKLNIANNLIQGGLTKQSIKISYQ